MIKLLLEIAEEKLLFMILKENLYSIMLLGVDS